MGRGRKSREDSVDVLFQNDKVRIEKDTLNYILTYHNGEKWGSAHYFSKLHQVFNNLLNNGIDDLSKEGFSEQLANLEKLIRTITKDIDAKLSIKVPLEDYELPVDA